MSVLSQSKWTIQCLDELCDIVIGRTPSRAQSQYWGAGHYWLSISDMGSFRDIARTKETITDAGAAICGNRLIHPGTVVLSFKLSIGKVGIVNVPMYTNEAIAALPVKDKSVLDEGYLYHALKVVNFTGRTDRAVMGQTLNKKKLQEIQIPLPPLEEQRRIAAILDKADAVRRKRQEAIALTEELLRSAFLEMFGDPVTNPKGWEIVPIESVAASTKNALAIGPFGSSLKVDDYRKSGYPVVFVRDIRENRFSWSSEVFVDEKKFQELQSHRVRPGDVIATKMGLPPCIAAVYPDSMPIGVVTADIIKVTLDRTKMTPLYVSAAINSNFCKRQVARFTEGITRPKVTLRDFKQLHIPCPPLCYQERWEALCNQHQAATARLSTDFDNLNNLFNSLLQRAFRGEL